jgi:two-component system, LuxR family, sensor kinase FixL
VPVETAELYRELHDHVRDIILVVDADSGRLIEVNRAAELAYQYSRGELLARTIYDLRVEAAGSVAEHMRAADRQGVLFEAVHRRRDGSVFPVEVSSRGETLGGGRYLLSIVRDITERKRADDERVRLLAATQQALSTREEFLWVASHELRTPVSVVGLQLHQLRRAIDRGDGAARLGAAAGAAIGQVERLAALIQRLLDAAQLDHGLRLDVTDVDLAELAGQAIERVRTSAEAVGVPITARIPEIRGRWDAVRIEQVLLNLLSNAVKYGLRQPVAVDARADGELVHIEVRDQGIGLAPAEAERIFRKFERAVPTASYGGLGLGLYIARQIVEAHRGSIMVDSAPGRGSTFRVTLPVAGPPR